MPEEELTPAEAKGYYAGFLIDKLNKIYDAWDQGDPELALRRSLRLTLALPRKLKEKIREDVHTIKKDMESVYRLQGSDFYTTELRRNKRSVEVASHYLAGFVDKLTDLLDEGGYFEIPGVKPKYPKEKTVWKR